MLLTYLAGVFLYALLTLHATVTAQYNTTYTTFTFIDTNRITPSVPTPSYEYTLRFGRHILATVFYPTNAPTQQYALYSTQQRKLQSVYSPSQAQLPFIMITSPPPVTSSITNLAATLAGTGTAVCVLQYSNVVNVDTTTDLISDTLFTINELLIENGTAASPIYNMLSSNLTAVCVGTTCLPTVFALQQMNTSSTYAVTANITVRALIAVQPVVSYSQQVSAVTAIQALSKPVINDVLMVGNSNCADVYAANTLPLYAGIRTNKLFVAVSSDVMSPQCNLLSTLLGVQAVTSVVMPYVQYVVSGQPALFKSYQVLLQSMYGGTVQQWYQDYVSNKTYYGSVSF